MTRRQYAATASSSEQDAAAYQPPEPMEPPKPVQVKVLEQKHFPDQVASDKLPPLPASTPAVSHKAQSSYGKLSRKSSAKSAARRRQLELAAAEAKAKISMDLIDKKLAADIAELDEDDSQADSNGYDVEKWWEQSQQELNTQHAPAVETNKDAAPCLPTNDVGTNDGTIQLLASAIKDLTTSANGPTNSGLMSRLCTPRDLPSFGDPMEWLFFKQAFSESSEVCKFSAKENLWRLRKSLYGAAKDAVSALLISSTTPEMVMDTLELQFGNPNVIISKILSDVNRLPVMSDQYHKDIVAFSVKIKNFVAAVLSVGQEEYLRGMSIMSTIISKLPTVLISKFTDYCFTLSKNNKTKLEILSDFLSEEAVKVTQTAVNFNFNSDYKRKQSYYTSNKVQTVLVQNSNDFKKCQFCRFQKHELVDCKKFKKALRKDKWSFVKRSGLCFVCLVSRHNKDTCQAPLCNIDNCGQKHHNLLHFVFTNNASQNSVNNSEPTVPEQSNETVNYVQTNSCKVLLKTVPIIVHGPNGTINTVALLDDGSTVTMISESLASRVGIKGHKKVLRVHGAWNSSELKCESEMVNFSITNKDGETFTVCAQSTSGLQLPTQIIELHKLKCKDDFLSGIKENLCDSYCKPEVLIGQDNYHLLLPLEIVKSDMGEHYFTRTPLGWCVHGRWLTTSNEDSVLQLSMLLTGRTDAEEPEEIRAIRELQEEVRHSFSIEGMGITAKPRENNNNKKAIEYLEQTATLKEGKWYVGLPWKDTISRLPESYMNAEKRLKTVERKMKANPEYAQRYTDRINHLLQNDYARHLPEPKVTSRTWYLPHFGVDNPNKKKLRLVFDAAAKNNDVSLNDCLHSGPDLLMSLYGVMLRFREQSIAVIGDIKDMFLAIKIIPEDQDSLKFLWRQSTEEQIDTYAMTFLIFGANCSPFIAQFIKNKNASRFQTCMPDAVQAIYEQHYMVDYIDSVENTDSAIKIIKEIAQIHMEGGFEIRNWASNNQTVIDSLPKDKLAQSAVGFTIGLHEERTLGLLWQPKEDLLGFDVSFKKLPESIVSNLKRPTKRELLRVIMSIFDVYGFLSPVTIKGKILLQKSWRINLQWDEEIPDNIYEDWILFIKQLELVKTISLPRCYLTDVSDVHVSETKTEMDNNLNSGAPRQLNSNDPRGAHEPTCTSNYNNLQLHVFCDASTQAMCAVAYWRWTNKHGNIQTAFISSRTRVVPVKHTTSMPRLELQAALIGARLGKTLMTEHRISTEEKYFWSDSSTVLQWIKNNERDYKAYVAHRLGEIDELTQMTEWHYVPTKQNVADLATRGDCDITIFSKEWLHGPDFLRSHQDTWPADIQPSICHEDLERVNLIVSERNLPAVPDPERFSSWLRLLKSTCAVLSFIDKCKKGTGEIDGSMMKKAERLLIQYSQRQSFASDLEHLEKEQKIRNNSKLLTLSPYIDEHGVLRVGGRISSAPGISDEIKHPVILDGRNHVTKLLVRHHHIRAAHGNRETVVNNLKQKYWIIKIRPTVKNVTTSCMLCRIRKARPEPPVMGDLPEARLSHNNRPFTFTGIDLFGPIEIAVNRRREKRYGVLFTCMTTRAIHIEIVTNLTADSLIMALRRMAARRGWPQNVFSDNGTNLRGADVELRKSIEGLDMEKLKDESLNYGTTWRFSPPASPHWGGAWERLIRSVKDSLKIILRERAPREEVLITLLAEVEQMVNSRPLTHVTVEPGCSETLTPNHFLLGSSSNLPMAGTFNESDLYLRKQWRISQQLADQFWKRWVTEVLPEMQTRSKWQIEQRPLQVGDLVLIVDPNSPRNVWPKGIIQRVQPGKDGRVRVVEVKTKSGILRRSAARIARISTEEEC